MLGNWTRQPVTAGGTGNLTLGSPAAGFIALSQTAPIGARFVYVIDDGTSGGREVGVGYLSDSATLVRETILETLVSGTLTRSSATAITVSTEASVMLSDAAQNFMAGWRPDITVADGSGFAGFHSLGHTHEGRAAQGLTAGYLFCMPFIWPASMRISQVAVSVQASAASSSLRIGLYAARSGGPGQKLIEFTDSATIDTSSTGLKTATSASPIFLPAGAYHLAATCSSGTPTFSRPQYSPGSGFYGVHASGYGINTINRAFTFGALPSDESGQSYTMGTNQQMISAWVK